MNKRMNNRMSDEQIINLFKYCNKCDTLDDCCKCSAYRHGICVVPDLGLQVLRVMEHQKTENARLKRELTDCKLQLKMSGGNNHHD